MLRQDCLFSIRCNCVLYMLSLSCFVSVLKNSTKITKKRLDVTNKILRNQNKIDFYMISISSDHLTVIYVEDLNVDLTFLYDAHRPYLQTHSRLPSKPLPCEKISLPITYSLVTCIRRFLVRLETRIFFYWENIFQLTIM
jgi:hypothetical protein